MRSPGSTVSSPDTIIHKTIAAEIERTFRPNWPNGKNVLTDASVPAVSCVLNLASGRRAATLEHQRTQTPAQLVRAQPAFDLAIGDDRDARRFLRHHDGHGVGLFGQSNGRHVARGP